MDAFWLHINTLSRVTLFCQILYYKNKGFTCSYWHIRLSQLFLKEIISMTSCTSPLQGGSLYSSVPSLLFIPSQLNIKKIRKLRNTDTKLCEVGSMWEAKALYITGITQDFSWSVAHSYCMPQVPQTRLFFYPVEVSIFHLILP